jgi:LPS sulfotransferase NodH
LASALWETGLAGEPDEYFGAATRAEYAKLWGAWTDERYVARVLEHGTTADGVFSVKLHGDHLKPARDTVRSALGPPPSGDPFSRLAPRRRYVWLKRRDKIRQGVSAFRALRGGAFAGGTALLLAPSKSLRSTTRQYGGASSVASGWKPTGPSSSARSVSRR